MDGSQQIIPFLEGSESSDGKEESSGCGTVNTLLRSNGGWLLGVDSDSSDTIIIDKGNGKKDEVCITLSDKDSKCCEIVNGVLLTACGKVKRCNTIRDHLKSIFEGQENYYLDFFDVYQCILEYLVDNKVDKKEDGVSMFLIGPGGEGKPSIAYLLGDGIEGSKIEDNFYSIGSGGRHATEQFQKFMYSQKGPMGVSSYNDDVQNVFKALYKATVRDPGCGGDLRVWYVDNDSAKEVKYKDCPSKHCLDIALRMGIEFSQNQMFFLDKHKYFSMNYYYLQQHLLSLGYEVRRPSSLGWVCGPWKLYLVDFDTVERRDMFFNRPSARCAEDKFRVTTYHRQVYADILIYYTPATADTLKLLRRGRLVNALT